MQVAVFAQTELNRKPTKYEEFISKAGIIYKYVDKSMKSYSIYANNPLKCKLRTFYGENKNDYFYIIENKNLLKGHNYAAIEYSDLVEINNAIAKLRNEVKADIELRPEYLSNYFISVDLFKIGYFIEKSKVTWTLSTDTGSDITILNSEEFANHFAEAQKEIETIIQENGK